MAVAVFGLVASPALATATSGYNYKITTGPYYPSWYADNCLDANIVDVANFQAYSRSSVSGGRCGGTGAGMAAGWIGVEANGYMNGSYCGSTGWYFNGSTTSTFGVGGTI